MTYEPTDTTNRLIDRLTGVLLRTYLPYDPQAAVIAILDAIEDAEVAPADRLKNRTTEVTEAMELLADIVRKVIPYGTQDGDFIASYLLPTGPIHRAIKYLQERGIPTDAHGLEA